MKRALLVSLLCLYLCSCAARSYSDSLDSAELAKRLTGEISGLEDYAEYTDEELSYLFELSADGYDACVLYSKDADDQGEIGVIRAPSEKDAKAMLRETQNYLDRTRTERRAFIESYLPSELSKLSSAEARQFGRYVVYTILESESAGLVFNATESALRSQ